MNVLGENPAKADVTLLLDNGADLPRFCGCPEIFIREFIMHIRAFSRYIFSVMTEEYSYPGDFPEDGEFIRVLGIFDMYEENGNKYLTLRDAVPEPVTHE